MSSDLNRRGFLTAAGLAGFAAQGRAAPADETPGAIKLGVASYSLREYSRALAIRCIKDLRTPYVSVKEFHLPYRGSPEELERGRKEFESAGLAIVSGGNITLSKDDPDDIRGYFQYAKMCGMPMMVCAPTHTNLGAIEKLVKEYDIRIAIHNHGPEDKLYPTPQSVLAVVRNMDPRCGLCMDVGHSARAGANVIESIAEAGSRLLDMHIKDLRTFEQHAVQCDVGEGIMPIAGIFKQLQKMGYRGCVNLEYEINGDNPLPGMRNSFSYMRGVLAGYKNGHRDRNEARKKVAGDKDVAINFLGLESRLNAPIYANGWRVWLDSSSGPMVVWLAPAANPAPCGTFSLMFAFRFNFSRLSRRGMVLGMVCAVYGQSSAGDAEATEAATRLIKMHRAWGPTLSSSDASIFLKELSRSGPIIKYRLFAKGLPHESKYTLVQWPVTQKGPTENLRGVTLNESGQAICAGQPDTYGSPGNPNDPIDLVLSPVKGEPFRFAWVSAEDKNVRAFLKVVPVPNDARDKSCLLEAILLMPHGEIVEIEGSGFEPNSDLEMESQSGKEHQVKTVKASSEGRYESAIMPFVKGEQHGTTHVKIKAAKCSPELGFDWGRRN